MQKLFYFACLLFFASSCKVQKPVQQSSNTAQSSIVQSNNSIEQQAKALILDKPELLPAHVGISLYDPTLKKYLFNYQSDKYFIAASKTNFFYCNAAM